MNYLTLVNKTNKIKNSYLDNINLINTVNIFGENVLVEKKVYDAYIELKEFLESKNIIIGIDSSYRSIEEQVEIMNYFKKEKGEKYCEKYVATPYYSEHHTGLAIDITIKKDNQFLIDNDQLFSNSNIFEQIHKYLNRFGFILRYPKGKENITGYSYEPWHIRYVGVIPATIIYDNNLCLEEYLNYFGGVLIVNKEKGMTSFDVVKKVSNILGIKKIGHTGTLDPLAEGVLVLTIGSYTKLGEDLTSLDKEYIAEVREGILTDTLDITGEVLQENDLRADDLEDLLKSYKKTYYQEVPKYSAVKVKGKKLYEYARRNEEVVLPKKEVTIKNIELLSQDKDTFSFKTTVSKGTYIRSLIRDIGNSSNTLMTMTKLIRTRQGKFKIEDSYTISDIESGNFKILGLLEVLSYPVINIDDELFKKVDNGVVLDNSFGINDKVIFRYRNQLIAIYKKDTYKLKMYKKILI